MALLGACSSPAPRTADISGALVYPGYYSGASVPVLPMAAQPIDTSTRNDLGANRPMEVVPGEVLVFFEEGASLQSFTGAELGIQAVRNLQVGSASVALYSAGGHDQASTLRLVEQVSNAAGVAAAYPNWVLHAFKTPNDTYYDVQWHYENMNLPAAWDIEDGSSSPVTVAVVDSGILLHPDIEANLLPGYDFISDPAVAGDGDGRDNAPWDMGGESGYHGLHVAGTVAATTNNRDGVAGASWHAKIVPVRVLGVTGSGSLADIMDGTVWAAGGTVAGVPNNPNPARVINMSLGGNIGEACPAELNDVFGQIAAAGVVVVVAAGNDDIDAAYTFPASCSNVITVGATGPLNTRAPYSNYGASIDVMASGGDVGRSFQVGGNTYPAGVLSTMAADDGYGSLMATYTFYQGTSMASPHIAGIAALMLANDPGLTFNDVRTRLQMAATPLGAGECERPSGNDCGAGLVDAAKALVSSGGGTPPPAPVQPPTTVRLTTYVAALHCLIGCYDFDYDKSTLIEVAVTANVLPYSISRLDPGIYYVAAWQDLNNNGEVDAGEPFGVYGNAAGGIPISLQAGDNLNNLVIVMEPLTLTGAMEPAEGLAVESVAMEALQRMAR